MMSMFSSKSFGLLSVTHPVRLTSLPEMPPESAPQRAQRLGRIATAAQLTACFAVMGVVLLGRIGFAPAVELMALLFALGGIALRFYCRFERGALHAARSDLGPARLPGWLPWMERFAVVMVIAGLLRHFVFSFTYAHGHSMGGSITPGAVALIDRTAYGIRMTPSYGPTLSRKPPARGDVIVLQFNASYKLAKRVIAIEGDELVMKAGRLWVNGQQLAWSDARAVDPASVGSYLPVPPGTHSIKERNGSAVYSVWANPGNATPIEPLPSVLADAERWPCTLVDQALTCRIPKGRFFALGDNRENSADSRALGLFATERIVGRSVLAWSPREGLTRFFWTN